MTRKHPLRRIVLGIAGTASAVVLLLALKQPGTSVAGASSEAGGAVPPAASATGGGGIETAGGRTVLGDVSETQYGPVQVRLTMSGGKITAAEAVKTPSADANSRKIAADAVPKLNQAAVTAQNAQIDTVSGATYTSEGYIASLQSALDKAGGGAGAGDSGAQEEAATGGNGGAEAGAGAGDAGSGDSDAASSGAGAGTGSGGAEAGAGSDAGAPKTVLGSVASTQYGDVQVSITVSGGKITAAEAVKTPSADANSRKIAADAVPKLNQAAVTAQNAQIDTVSGASYTSEGYIQSLQSAIDKAGL